MSASRLAVALIHDVFHGTGALVRLRERLVEARERGAGLAVLPELPLDPWAPATREVRDDDAEPPGGPRHQLQATAAAEAGVALIGGAIVRDPQTGRRHNTALAFDARGDLLASYHKLHLPHEPGFWEADHYEAGETPATVIDGLPLRLGVQLCSDVQRPAGSQVLAARGAELLVVPRCTPPESYERWKLVLRANAITCCAFVVSTNRPGPEPGVSVGGPSLAIAPDGEVLAESTRPLTVVTLSREALDRARADYPGYLPVRGGLYARAWKDVGS